MNRDRERRGERIGWLGGWMGGFLWMGVFAVWWLIEGRWGEGIAVLALFLLGIVLVFRLAPWRFPHSPYLRLMLPFYAVFIAGSVLIVLVMDARFPGELRWYMLIPFMGLLTPLITLGRRTWADGEPRSQP